MTKTRVGINGFGRMGRLALRVGWDSEDLEFVHINELHGDAVVGAHLLTFDSVHGRWDRDVTGDDDALNVNGHRIGFSSNAKPEETPWDDLGVDVVIESSGKFRTMETLAPYFDRGVKKVVVAAPVKDERALNVVVGVNDDRYDPARYDVVTAASCTTNCLAPVVKVIHEGIGIERGVITTLHDQYPDDRRRPAQRPASGEGCKHVAHPNDDGVGNGDRPDLPGAEREAQRSRRAGAAAQRPAR